MSNINLRKDLELWVDFSERYWNPQTNRIQDQSGYGRHPEASGGPTLGAEGPNNFEAASFDGSDDKFEISDVMPISDEQTVFGVFKIPDKDNPYWIAGNGITDNGMNFYVESGGPFTFQLYNGEGFEVNATMSIETDKWITGVGIWDDETMSIYANDLLGETEPLSTHTVGSDPLRIGEQTSNKFEFKGEMATVARWSRALSDAEIEALNNLTAPRRSNL